MLHPIKTYVMKLSTILLSVLLFSLFSSFTASEACEYAGSNIGYINSQTQKALDAKDLNQAKYYTYKALKAIYKSQKQLNDCGCDEAGADIEESQYNLRMATKATSFKDAKVLLDKARKKAMTSLGALEKHHLHEGVMANEELPEESLAEEANTSITSPMITDVKKMYKVIDSSLLKYEKSLNKVVNSVNCKEALEYANGVYEHCEKQLLRPDLSDVIKYYNLQTKKITAAALAQLKDCQRQEIETQVTSSK